MTVVLPSAQPDNFPKQTPFADKESLQMVTKLVRSMSAYLLIFGENQSRLPEIIKQILTENQ